MAGKEGSTPAEHKVDEMRLEIDALKAKNEVIAGQVTELTKQLAAANAVIEGDIRGGIVGDIVENSVLTQEDCIGKSLDELKTIRDHVKLSKRSFHSVNDAGFAGPMGTRHPNYILDDMFEFDAKKK